MPGVGDDRIQRWIACVGHMLGVGLVLLPVAASGAQPPDIAAMAQREITLLRFYGGGSPLSAQEQREAAGMVQSETQRAPQAELIVDAGAAKLLHVLNEGTPALVALARESGRLAVQPNMTVNPVLQPQQAMEARIIIAHDPVIVFDATHRRLISEQTVRVLQRGDTLGAAVFDVSQPSADFADQMRRTLPRAWPGMDDGVQEGMAHAERDLPYAAAFLQSISPQDRAGFVRTWRAKILAAPDATGRQLNLAEVMAVIGMTAFRRSQSVGGIQGVTSSMQMQDLANRKLEGAVRSYSPTCDVTRPDAMTHWASCHP
jgi:hypothetical protein